VHIKSSTWHRIARRPGGPDQHEHILPAASDRAGSASSTRRPAFRPGNEWRAPRPARACIIHGAVPRYTQTGRGTCGGAMRIHPPRYSKWLARGLSPVVAPLSDPESAKKKRLPPDFTSHHACWVNYLQNSLPGVTQ
jgi:hypothetical protein